LGKQLAALAGREFGEYRIERAGAHRGAARYRLLRGQPNSVAA